MELKLVLIAAAGICAGLPFGARAELDLAPLEGVYIGEATPFRCIRFRDGTDVIRFVPPPEWKFVAESGRCAFFPPKIGQASGAFSTAPLPKEKRPRSGEELQQLLRELIPADATKVEFTTEGLPQVRLERWDSQHVQATYEHFGQTFRVALLVVPLASEELRARFGSRVTDFHRAFPMLLESLGTFTWNPTDEDRPAKADGRAR